jgi:hypothetical protein
MLLDNWTTSLCKALKRENLNNIGVIEAKFELSSRKLD